MNCLSLDDFRIVALSEELGLHKALVVAKVAVWQEVNDTKEFPTAENLGSKKIDNSNIHFLEESAIGYKSRTIKNASADATIAIATDFTSGGERLTKSSVEKQNKKYIPIDIKNTLKVTDEVVNNVVNQLNNVNAKTLNIAGNGIYTMKGKYTQKQIDDYTYELLKAVLNSPNLKNKIEKIRTGGQTGLDEAGAKAGKKLGIPTMILAPKGWTFRNESGQDISDEKQFKERFGSFTSQGDLFSTNIFSENKSSNDVLILRRIVDEYFKAKDVSDVLQNVQVLQQLIKGFKGTFAESEAFISALNKLGYDINKDYNGIVAHTSPDQKFYKNWKNVTSKVDGIDRILNDKFLKQSIITAIDLMKVSKLFFISQTSLAKNIRDNISSLFKDNKTAKTDFKNNFRKNFLSYLTATAYRHSVRNDEDLKLPHIKDFLLTPLAEITDEDNKEYNELQSKFLQIVFHNKENGINNEFLNFLQIENIDYDKHEDSMLYGYRLHQFVAQTRTLKDPEKISRLLSGFNELYFANNNNILESDPEVKRINNLKHEFAKEMFNYLLVKDGLMYQNQSFIKAIDPILFLETSYKLDEIQQLFKKNTASSNEFLKIFGLTKEELELDFTLKFGLHSSNYFDLKSQRLDVILTDKKDRDAKIAKDLEEQKKDKDSEDNFENAGEGFEEDVESEELVKEDNYPLYFNNEDNSLTVNQFAGQTSDMSSANKKQNKADNKRYILAKENEIFKTILEPFKTPDGQIKHYAVIGLPIITYVNKKIGNNITKRIPLKLSIVQNTVKVNGNMFLTFQFSPEGYVKRVDSRTMTKLKNLGVMFTDLQENSIFDIINNTKSLKLKTSQASVKHLVEIAQELSKFYRGGYIIGTKAKFIDYMTFGSAKLSSFGDDIKSQESIKLSEKDTKTSMTMYNRKDKTIKEEDKRKILLDNINKLESTSDFSYKMEDFEGMLTSDMEEHYKNQLKVMDNSLTEQELENKIKECYAKIKK